MNTEFIEQKLVQTFSSGEWGTTRSFFRNVWDKNPFISSTVISILAHCRIENPELIQCINDCKRHIQSYQKNGLTYHWPFNKKGLSLMPNSMVFSKLSVLKLSPDADCSALAQIASNDEGLDYALMEALEFYRYDKDRFRLSKFQTELSDSLEGSFLTWFPPKDQCVNRKMESIDVVVQSNILWMLGEKNMLEINGVNETIASIMACLTHPLLLKNPYRFSPYYPFLHVILYSVTRAAVWGNIPKLREKKQAILQLCKHVPLKTDMEKLCVASIYKWFQEDAGALKNERQTRREWDDSPMYVLAFTEAFHCLEVISRQSVFQIKFHSDALKWAKLRWLYD